MTHNHPYHFNLHPTTVTTANMVFWVAVTLLALRTLKGFVKCTALRVGQTGPLSVLGTTYGLRNSVRTPNVVSW